MILYYLHPTRHASGVPGLPLSLFFWGEFERRFLSVKVTNTVLPLNDASFMICMLVSQACSILFEWMVTEKWEEWRN